MRKRTSGNWLHPDEEERKEALCHERPSYMRIVQYADALAAGKWSSFLPGNMIEEEKVRKYNDEDVKKAIDMLWKRKE